MRGGWGLAAILGLALLAPVAPSWAGTIYRCDAEDGTRSYVSKRVKGASCVAVSNYSGARSGAAIWTRSRLANAVIASS